MSGLTQSVGLVTIDGLRTDKQITFNAAGIKGSKAVGTCVACERNMLREMAIFLSLGEFFDEDDPVSEYASSPEHS